MEVLQALPNRNLMLMLALEGSNSVLHWKFLIQQFAVELIHISTLRLFWKLV